MSSNDVDILWGEINFKEGDLEPLLVALRGVDAPTLEPAPVAKEWNVLNTTDLGDGKILEVRVLEPVVPVNSLQGATIADQIAIILNGLLPGGLDAMVGWQGETLTIEGGGGESMGWADVELLGRLLEVLVPYLDEGSEVQLSETLHNIWRFVVKDGKIVEEEGRIVFGHE